MEPMEAASKVRRLGFFEGYQEKQNEIIYHPPRVGDFRRIVVFFGGDVQDYKENMLIHRDNKHYSEWDLESTALLMHRHFPDDAVIIIKPSKMALKTFSCFENFADVNNFGVPTYQRTTDGFKHLKLLLENVSDMLKIQNSLSSIPLTIIGFSKGCIVLNQFLHAFQVLSETFDPELEPFLKNITDMYWLEGGHSGSTSTWVTDKTVLKSFADLEIHVHIHVTPYQVRCESRPKIGKEEKIFREYLESMNVNLERKLHFESLPRSLENHFQVLNCFKE